MSAVKVLISGDPEGKLGALFKRVSAVNKSNGPFDYLFCVGSFFPPAGEAEDSAEADAEVLEYVSGKREVPVPTFFVGASGRGSRAAMAVLAAAGNPRLKYLGPAGVTRLKGLNVAYLDGVSPPAGAASASGSADELQGCRYHSQANLERLTSAVEHSEGDIDLFLTCEWPADVAAGLPLSALPAGLQPGGSDAAAKLAVTVRPRYHVAGGKGLFWARAPYMNKDLGAGGHATRFVGLAAVGVQDWRWQDRKKGRPAPAAPSLGRPGVVKDDTLSIYVKNLPFHASEADLEAFFCQAGPVADIRRGLNAEGKLNGFGHIQFDSPEAVQRALALHGSQLMGREVFVDAATNRPAPAPLPSGKPVQGCWFCLSNPNADVELVASVGEECYVAVDKGAINDGHTLVLPIEHYPSSLQLPPGAYAEMERYLSALHSCYAAKGQELVAFERFMSFRKTGGNHCHINVVPCPAAAASTARVAFDKAAAAVGAAFTELPRKSGEGARAALQAAVGDSEFLRITLPGGTQLVHTISRGERFPLNFGREVAALLAGTPERADWKKCTVEPAEESARTARFKERFKPYDIMQ